MKNIGLPLGELKEFVAAEFPVSKINFDVNNFSMVNRAGDEYGKSRIDGMLEKPVLAMELLALLRTAEVMIKSTRP